MTATAQIIDAMTVAYCDGCGVMGCATPRFGWKRFKWSSHEYNTYRQWRHHCKDCCHDFRLNYDKAWV